MTVKTDPKSAASSLPPGLQALALLHIGEVVAAVKQGKSWIYAEVRAGRFPAPLRYGPRCTRWKASSVQDWLIQRIEQAEADTEAAGLASARGAHASRAAQAKRSTAVSAASGQ